MVSQNQRTRAQVPGLSNPSPIQPQARPVDTFQAPQAPAQRQAPDPNNSLSQVGAALSRFNPKLQSVIQAKNDYDVVAADTEAKRLKELEERNIEEAKVLGGKYALENQLGWNELVKTHPEAAGSNPWLRVYYEKAIAGKEALDFDREVRTAWATSEDKNSQDPAAFDNFYNTKLKTRLEKTKGLFGDKAFAEDFLPEINKSKAALSNEHINYQQKLNLENAESALEDLSFTKLKTFQEGFNKGLVDLTSRLSTMSPKQAASTLHAYKMGKFQEWGSSLSEEGKKARLMGVNGTKINIGIAKAIIAAAEQANDPDILDLANHVQGGSGPLSNIREVQSMLKQSRLNIFTEEDQNLRHQDFLEERKKKHLQTDTFMTAYDMLQKNPFADVSNEIILLNNAGLPEKARDLQALQRTMQKEDQDPVTDTQSEGQLMEDIYTNPKFDITKIGEMRRDGKISKDTADKAYREYRFIQEDADKDYTYTGTHRDSIKSMADEIRSTLKPQWSGMKNKSGAAVSDFFSKISEFKQNYKKKNGELPPTYEVEEFAEKYKGTILSRAKSKGSGVSLKPSGSSPAPKTHHEPAAHKPAPPPAEKPDPTPIPKRAADIEKRINADHRLSPAKKKELIERLKKVAHGQRK